MVGERNITLLVSCPLMAIWQVGGSAELVVKHDAVEYPEASQQTANCLSLHLFIEDSGRDGSSPLYLFSGATWQIRMGHA